NFDPNTLDVSSGGTVIAGSGFVISGLPVNGVVTLQAASSGSLVSMTFGSAGAGIVQSGGAATGTVVSSGGSLTVMGGGVDSGTTIQTLGVEFVSSAGSAVSATVL